MALHIPVDGQVGAYRYTPQWPYAPMAIHPNGRTPQWRYAPTVVRPYGFVDHGDPVNMVLYDHIPST